MKQIAIAAASWLIVGAVLVAHTGQTRSNDARTVASEPNFGTVTDILLPRIAGLSVHDAF